MICENCNERQAINGLTMCSECDLAERQHGKAHVPEAYCNVDGCFAYSITGDFGRCDHHIPQNIVTHIHLKNYGALVELDGLQTITIPYAIFHAAYIRLGAQIRYSMQAGVITQVDVLNMDDLTQRERKETQ